MSFLNPITSPKATFLCGLTIVAAGALGSLDRLETTMAEGNHNRIAAQRAQVCRILPASEKLELGAYYFQPTQQNSDGMSGVLLDEGVYVCDRYGATARIERGGYAQFIAISTDVGAINKTLKGRLEDSSNPDHSKATQVQRAANMGVHRDPPKDSKPPAEPNFFNLN